MEVMKSIYIGGTTSREKWDWSTLFKIGLKGHFCVDGEVLTKEILDKGPWTFEDHTLRNTLKSTADYELYVITPESTGLMTVAEVIDAAHRRKDRCIFLPIKSVSGPDFSITMTPNLMRSTLALETFVSSMGGRVFVQPKDVLSFLNSDIS